MRNETEATVSETEVAVVKQQWQTPDFEELDIRETANGVPPITGPGDGVNAYS